VHRVLNSSGINKQLKSPRPDRGWGTWQAWLQPITALEKSGKYWRQ